MDDKLYDRPEICSTYFFPQPDAPLPRGDSAEPVGLALSDGTPIGGFWSRPLDGAPTLLYLHGNGERIADQLAGKHWLFGADEQIERLMMCDDCRVIVQFDAPDSPFAGAPRPQVQAGSPASASLRSFSAVAKRTTSFSICTTVLSTRPRR